MTSIKTGSPETTFRRPTKSNGTRKFVFINKNDKENKIELQLANPEKSSEYLWQPFDVSQPMNPPARTIASRWRSPSTTRWWSSSRPLIRLHRLCHQGIGQALWQGD